MTGQMRYMTKLAILSDPICPWCYIGKARLERALEQRPGHDFIVSWHPYMLNPEMPAEGMDRRQYLEQKFGGKEGAVRVYSQIDEAAKADGLDLNLGGIKRTPNTLDAHRLIYWAGIEGKQNAVVDRLFKAYFKEGRDISEPSTLLRIATGAGMDKDATKRLLESDADKEPIMTGVWEARQKGVTGVPCFVVDNLHVVNGAQPPELWLQVIDELAEKAAGE